MLFGNIISGFSVPRL